MKSDRRRKITPAQQDELILAFVEFGKEFAGLLAPLYGVGVSYPVSLAYERGIRRPTWRKGTRYKDQYRQPKRHIINRKDPRWAKARAVGVVVI